MINVNELETLNKHELGSLKSIMTMSENRIRRPYAHFADQMIRRASFVGSINKDSFLADETGSRRFLVFEVASIDPDHTVDMDRVHAQAYSLFKSGFRYWFDRDETATVNERNKEYSIQTTEDELVAKYCSAGSANEWRTATEVAQRMSNYCSYPLKTSSARDFGYALRLSVYEILGREVSVLVNEVRDAGVHEVKFDASGLSSGVYFYRLQAGDFTQTKRLMILK